MCGVRMIPDTRGTSGASNISMLGILPPHGLAILTAPAAVAVLLRAPSEPADP